jgi:hypothetical protein
MGLGMFSLFLFLAVYPGLHGGRQSRRSLRIDIKNSETLAFPNPYPQQTHPSFGVVYLLQFDLLSAQRDG